MRRFVAEQNIKHYRDMLEHEPDAKKREQLQRLLADALTDLERQEDEGAADGQNLP
jgi:hypothetical protein